MLHWDLSRTPWGHGHCPCVGLLWVLSSSTWVKDPEEFRQGSGHIYNWAQILHLIPLYLSGMVFSLIFTLRVIRHSSSSQSFELGRDESYLPI